MKSIAKTYRLSRGQVCRITSEYLEGNLTFDTCYRDQLVELPSLDDVKRYLTERYEEVGYISVSYKVLREELRNKFPSLRMVADFQLMVALKEYLNLKKVKFDTRPARITNKECNTIVLGYFRLLADLIDQNVTILTCDETGFFSDNFCKKAVAAKGMLPMRQKRSAVIGVHMIACLSQHRLISFQVKSKNFTSAEYCHFIAQTLSIVSKDQGIDQKRVVWLHDNSPCHRTKESTALLRSKGLRTINTLPASPLSNPVEHLFADLKSFMKANVHLTRDQVLNELNTSLHRVANKPGSSYFRRSFREMIARETGNQPN